MFYKSLLIIILFLFVACNKNYKQNLLSSNIIIDKNAKTDPEKAFILSWEIEENVITRIPLKIKNILKVKCINYNKTVLIKVTTNLNDIVNGTFECRV